MSAHRGVDKRLREVEKHTESCATREELAQAENRMLREFGKQMAKDREMHTTALREAKGDIVSSVKMLVEALNNHE